MSNVKQYTSLHSEMNSAQLRTVINKLISDEFYIVQVIRLCDFVDNGIYNPLANWLIIYERRW